MSEFIRAGILCLASIVMFGGSIIATGIFLLSESAPQQAASMAYAVIPYVFARGMVTALGERNDK